MSSTPHPPSSTAEPTPPPSPTPPTNTSLAAAPPDDPPSPTINTASLRTFLRLHALLHRFNQTLTRVFNFAAVVAIAALLARSRSPWSGRALLLRLWLLLDAVLTVTHGGLHAFARFHARRVDAAADAGDADAAARRARVRRVVGVAAVLTQVAWAGWVLVGVVFAGVYRGVEGELRSIYVGVAVLAVGTLVLSQIYTVGMVALMCTEGAREFRALTREAATGGSGTRRPASRAEVVGLGMVQYVGGMFEDSADAVCAICLTEYEEGDELRVLPCREKAGGDIGGTENARVHREKRESVERANADLERGTSVSSLGGRSVSKIRGGKTPLQGHAFHVECIDAWLQRSRQCPVCKQDIVPSMRDSPSPLTNAIRNVVMSGSVSVSADMTSSDHFSTDGATVGTDTYGVASVSSSVAVVSDNARGSVNGGGGAGGGSAGGVICSEGGSGTGVCGDDAEVAVTRAAPVSAGLPAVAQVVAATGPRSSSENADG